MTRPGAPRPPAARPPGARDNAVRVAAPDGTAWDGPGAPDAGPAPRDLAVAYRVTLTALGVLALAADRLAACHREAHPEGCPGCDACRRLLPLLRRLLAAGRAAPEAA